MKKLFILLCVFIVLLACNNSINNTEQLKNDKIRFEKNWKAFEKYHVGGVVNKDIDLFLELYSIQLNGVHQIGITIKYLEKRIKRSSEKLYG